MILAATISAAMLVVANVSSLNVALPQLSRALDASQTAIAAISAGLPNLLTG